MKCKELLGILGDKRIELEDQSISARASSPLSGRNSLNRRHQRMMHQSSGGIRSASWKKSSANLARSKFGPPSSTRSSVSPHLSSRDLHLNEKVRHSVGIKCFEFHQCFCRLFLR